MKLTTPKQNDKLLIKKCHYCGHLNSGHVEPEKCESCKKSYLPLNYFSKIHDTKGKDIKSLYASSDELHEEEIIKGLTVIW